MVKSLRYIWIMLLIWGTGDLAANNIRIVGDVKVDPLLIGSDNLATIELQVEWDNSWRDGWNYDAAYLFLKYKLVGEKTEWYHLYLANTGHVLGSGYTHQLANSTGGADRNEGVFVYRDDKSWSSGKTSVLLKLKWLITRGDLPLTRAHFDNGQVEVSAMALEMVYVPRGPFRVGDGASTQSFCQNHFPLADKYCIALGRYHIESPAGEPRLAANRLNDIFTSGWSPSSTTNAWIGSSVPQWWMVDFGKDNKGNLTGEKKMIRFFGIEGHPSYNPNKWRLEGSNDAVNAVWDTLYNSETGQAGDWVVDMQQVYPVTKAIAIKKPAKYRYYRVYVETMRSGTPLIKSIALSEMQVDSLYDKSVLVYKQQTEMGTTIPSGAVYGSVLNATDGSSWSGITPTTYPNGYGGFFVMKYELTQEQYVVFLNKLTYTQQLGIVGPLLKSNKEGEYIFGVRKDSANYRNGIVLAKRSVNGSRTLFANDLNKANGYNEADDGQALACNYISITDLLAYADWCGLRPLTEMEYEKMGRYPYPYTPKRGEFPWNTKGVKMVTQIAAGTEGKVTEKADGNVNAGGKLKGPLRVGSFASNAVGQEAAGASYWGIMDLAGNLEEIFYNVNPEGRAFTGMNRGTHGNGTLPASGVANISGCPTAITAFAFRGGHFGSKENDLRTSSRHRLGITGNSVSESRDSATSFRLGFTVPYQTLASVLMLENGQTTNDTLFSNSEYRIRGDRPVGMRNDSTTYMWFRSENRGVTWELIEGANGKDLKIKNMYNRSEPALTFGEYRFYRKCFTMRAEATSQTVIIRILNPESLSLSHYVDTIDYYGGMTGKYIKGTNYFARFNWKWEGQSIDPQYNTARTGNQFVEYFAPQYNVFQKEGKQVSGDQIVELEGSVSLKAWQREQIKLYVKPEPAQQKSAEVTCGNYMIDERDGKIYPTVMIGDRCWMAKNLDYRVAGSLCYSGSVANCDIYGALYNWNQAVGEVAYAYPVQGICPKGWHVPMDNEWRAMWNDAGGNYTYIRSASALWGTSGVNIPNNRSRFSALPGGGYFYGYNNGYGTYAGINSRTGYYDVRERGWWWTSTSRVHYWTTYSNNNDNNIMNIPYYVRMDYNTNMYFNTPMNRSYYQYLNQSIFCGSDYRHLTSSYNSIGVDVGNNKSAETNVHAQFYMSIRCIKDTKAKPLVNQGGGWMWRDDTYARSALEYLKTSGTTLTSDYYWIDPDGDGGEAPYLAYCDMTTDGGGWTRFDDVDNGPHGAVSSTKNRVNNLTRFQNLAAISLYQKVTEVQGNSYNSTNNYYGFYTYYNVCVAGMFCNISGSQSPRNVEVKINGSWTAAMYKTYFNYYNAGVTYTGASFNEMWFR